VLLLSAPFLRCYRGMQPVTRLRHLPAAHLGVLAALCLVTRLAQYGPGLRLGQVLGHSPAVG
jgi:hypothetical protein